MARWFLLVCLYCALASSVKADYDFSVPGSIRIMFNYDGCSNANVTLTVSGYGNYVGGPNPGPLFSGGHVVNSVTLTCSPGENYTGFSILTAANGSTLANYNAEVAVTGVSGTGVPITAPLGQMPSQGGNLNNGTTTGPCSSSYSPWAFGGNPCAQSKNGCNTVDQMQGGYPATNSYGQPTRAITFNNNTGTSYRTSDGQTIPPGGSLFDTSQYVNEGGGTTNTFLIFPVNNYGNTDGGNAYNINGYTNIPGVTLGNGPQNGDVAADLLGTNGGPILWNNSTATNPALATEAGMSALANGQNQQILSGNDNFLNLSNQLNGDQTAENMNFSNLLNSLHNSNNPVYVQMTDSNQSSGGSSNVWVQNWPTNFPNGDTNSSGTSSNIDVGNWPIDRLTNSGATNQIANAFNQVYGSTGMVYGIAAPMAGVASSIQSQLPSTLSDDNGSAQEQDITIGDPSKGTITIRAGTVPSSMTAWYSHLRALIAWLIVVVLLMLNAKQVFEALRDIFLVEPVERVGLLEAVASLGAGVAVVLALAVGLVLLIGILPTVAVGFLSGELTFLGGGGTESPSTFFGNMGWSYQWASQFFPIWVMVTAMGSRIVFFFAIEILKAILEAIVKIFVASS